MPAEAASAMATALVRAADPGRFTDPTSPLALVSVRGRPLVFHAVRGLFDSGRVDFVVVAAPVDQVSRIASELAPFDHRVLVCAGQREAVRRVLGRAPDAVVLHDVARAFAPAWLVSSVVGGVLAGGSAVVPVVSVTDTVKAVDAEGFVLGTVDRDTLRQAQTPVGLSPAALRAADGTAGDTQDADELAMIRGAGVPIRTVTGHPDATAIRTPVDVAIIEGRAGDSAARAPS